MTDRDLALVVNVRGRWPEVLRGQSTVEEVVLGDWNLADRDINPARVAAVLGSRQRQIVAGFTVAGDPIAVAGYDRPRVRFRPGRRLHHLEGLPSPYSWQRGEMYPVVDLPVDALGFDLDDTATTDRRANLGGFILTLDAAGDATVLAPPGRAVTVRTLPTSPVGVAPGQPDGRQSDD
ncbi:hypothetical protein ACNTMW_30905 [Planosporangium sp. 12N6]|uniref:hypothetical protein n=1 Tax=Planosporangium spinosum TaxID=3402278 RepID=UPI003CE9EEAF